MAWMTVLMMDCIQLSHDSSLNFEVCLAIEGFYGEQPKYQK